MHPATDRAVSDGRDAGIVVRRHGRRSYADGEALQAAAVARVAAGGADELLYLEHGPVITLGRGAADSQLRAAPGELADAGIAVAHTDRGGGATYHGPGQLVGYPVVDLRRRDLGVRAYLRALESALVAVLRTAGVDAAARPGLTGVWTRRGKLAAIGISVRRGITRHGFALNVTTELTAFDRIVPCGLDAPVTSLADLGCDAAGPWLHRRVAAELETALATEGAGGAFPGVVTASAAHADEARA